MNKHINNKTIAILALVSVWLPAVMGIIEELTSAPILSEAVYMVLGLLMLIFATWAAIRLMASADKDEAPHGTQHQEGGESHGE